MSTSSILIVEDEQSLREMYTDAFAAAGINVMTATNGADGVALALEKHPSIILMDIMMPGDLNGHEAVAKIRADQWGRSAKVIFLTNMSDAENVVEAVGKGSIDYIIKANVTPKEMVNQVRMALGS